MVSGEPNITPTFSRSWLMNTQVVRDLFKLAVSLRIACDMSRACSPTCESPISPSSSALGVKAATESTTITSTAPERMSWSAMSKACSPVSGCEMSRLSMSTPMAAAYTGSIACSASMKAHTPPAFCASATMWRAKVVFPEDSGP